MDDSSLLNTITIDSNYILSPLTETSYRIFTSTNGRPRCVPLHLRGPLATQSRRFIVPNRPCSPSNRTILPIQ
jgi:hypothetical protein